MTDQMPMIIKEDEKWMNLKSISDKLISMVYLDTKNNLQQNLHACGYHFETVNNSTNHMYHLVKILKKWKFLSIVLIYHELIICLQFCATIN